MALTAVFHSLSLQTVLLIICTLFAFPFAIYYITLSLFQRRVRSDTSGKSPPTVPYYIPGVFHAFSLAYTGPQKYFAQLLYAMFSFGRYSMLMAIEKSMMARILSSSMLDHSHFSSSGI